MHDNWSKIPYAMRSCWLPLLEHTLQLRAALCTCTLWQERYRTCFECPHELLNQCLLRLWEAFSPNGLSFNPLLKLLCAAAVNASLGLPLLLLRFTHPAHVLQTKSGNKAQGITSAEFTEIMGKLKETLETQESKSKLRRRERWLYSYDNDKVHKGADLSEAGILPQDRFDLPPCSSDMHKAVEHVHAWLQAKMQLWLEEQQDQRLTADVCKSELERLFFQVLKPSSIAADVASLKDTYQAIIDADGGYPPKKYR